MKHRTSAILIAALALLSTLTANAQSPNMVADIAARINHERTMRGLIPYALNSDLTAAAQAHANDMAATGKLSHTGSDGSTVFQRVARTGYGSYSWGRRLGENWAWYHSTDEAMQKWMNSAPHRDNILHPLYREFGIGITPNPVGGYIFVINFGAQPNVLPIFLNDGAGSTPGPGVTVTLSDEHVSPSGDTAATIGHPTEIQISNEASFAGAKWEPYAARKSWTLIPGTGARTVYVKLRDSRGRAVTTSDSITVGGGAAAGLNTFGASQLAKPTASATLTRRPTATRTRTPRPTASPSPTRTRTRVPTATDVPAVINNPPVQALSTMTPTVEPTATPKDSATLTDSEPPEITAVALAQPNTIDESAGDRIADIPATSQEMTPSLWAFAASASSGMGAVAAGVFTVAAVLGIMAVIRFCFRRNRNAVSNEHQETVIVQDDRD